MGRARRQPATRSSGMLRRLPGRLAAYGVVSALIGVLLAALTAPWSLGLAQGVRATGQLLDRPAAPLPPQDELPRTSVVLDATGRPLTWLYLENRTPVTLASMSPYVRRAIVAVEDARFYQHGAADPRGLLRAAIHDLTGRGIQGASTLTQQYVKNVLQQHAVLTGDQAEQRAAVARTPARKLEELRLAMAVERQSTKDQILEGYLNLVNFGRGNDGVQAAAQRYFGIPASRLTLAQAALLAGMVQSPASYDPIAHPAAALARRSVVLTDLLDQHLITPDDFRTASRTPITVAGNPRPNGCAPTGPTAFFCEYVLQSLLHDPRYAALGATAELRDRVLRTGGLVIRTGLDPQAQSAAVRGVARIPPSDPSGLAAASVTVQPGTGMVVAMAQNRTYATTEGRGRTSVDYSVDSALGGARGFQTGSSFKPFTLATWLARGRSLRDTVDATKRAFPFADFTACGDRLRGTAPYRPGNSEGTETGRMSVLAATTNSVNVAYVDMESRLDLCDIARTAEQLGVHLASPEQECSTSGTPSTDLPTCLPSLTLGVKDIAPLTMAAAYAGFATGGIFCEPVPVTAIDRQGSTIGAGTGVGTGLVPVLRVAPQCRRALPSAVASGVTAALRQVLTSGTAAAVGPLQPWPSAGKTGTTDGPYDTWFVGYTAQRSTAVWVGDPGHQVNGTFVRRRLTGIEVAGRSYPVVYGASIAAPIWKEVMTGAMAGLPARRLP